MRIFYVLATVVALAIVSTVSGQLQLDTQDDADVRFVTTKSGRKLHDDFYKLIEAQVPVQNAINQALTWNVEAQYEHFELLQEHIQAGDKYAKYCNELVKAAQDMLDETLDRINIGIRIKICEYIKGLYDFEGGRPITSEMRKIITGINEYRTAVVKKLEEQQAQAQAQAEAADAEGAQSEENQSAVKDAKQPEVESDDDDSDNELDNLNVNQPSVEDKEQGDKESIEKQADTESQTFKITSMGI